MANTKLDVEVRDAQGNLASLTEGGREFRKQFGMGGSPHTAFSARQTRRQICVLTAGEGLRITFKVALYDMSRPGDYTIQVSHFDDETKTWVKSNKITVTVTP